MKNISIKFESQFIKKEKLSKDVYSFYFDRVRVERGSGKRSYAEDFDFIFGQYVRLTLQIDSPDERGTSRYFTISSSPTDLSYFTITTRIIKSSFKMRLNSLKPGEIVTAFGPIGYFNFDINNKKPKIFLAGGIGITPYHSILRYIDNKALKLSASVTLIVSFSTREEVIFFEELKEIENRNSNIRVVCTLTNDNNMYPKFKKGRIDISLIKKYTQDKDSEFFIVGSGAFETNMIELLNSLEVPEVNIFMENFPGY